MFGFQDERGIVNLDAIDVKFGISVARVSNIWYGFRSGLHLSTHIKREKARSSVGEHFLDAEGVGGSIPPVPTNPRNFSTDTSPA